MIIDKLSNLGMYANMNDNLRTAIEFLQSHDLNALPKGRNEADGDNVYVNVADGDLTSSNTRWETHAVYADIQLVVQGKEVIGYAFPTDAPATEPMNPAIDAALYDGLEGVGVLLQPGEAMILFPNEPHQPGVMPEGKPGHVRKIIAKVKMN